jgi:GH18 family chitinase
MTYDMRFGCCGWDTWLWAALKGAGPSYPSSVESSIQGYVAAGVPRSKLGMGLGLYGGGYGPPVTGPRQTIAGEWGGDDNTYNYRDFYNQGMLGGAGATYVFDATAQTGYYRYSPARTYRGNTVSVLVTEDEQSIAAKGAWARAGNCGGTIVWAINYGYVNSTVGNPPMAAVKQAFLTPVPVELQTFTVE